MEEKLSKNYSKRYYFGIPAPTSKQEFPDELDIKRFEMIKIYNSLLKKEVLSRGSYFLDVYFHLAIQTFRLAIIFVIRALGNVSAGA